MKRLWHCIFGHPYLGIYRAEQADGYALYRPFCFCGKEWGLWAVGDEAVVTEPPWSTKVVLEESDVPKK